MCLFRRGTTDSRLAVASLILAGGPENFLKLLRMAARREYIIRVLIMYGTRLGAAPNSFCRFKGVPPPMNEMTTELLCDVTKLKLAAA